MTGNLALKTSPQELEFVARCKEDYPFFAKNTLQIKTDHTQGRRGLADSTQIIPFVFDRTQHFVWEQKIKPKLDARKPVRIIYLKPRQKGGSTFFAGLGYWWAITRFSQGVFVLGHDDKSAANIFDKHQTFYKYSPSYFQLPFDKFNRKEIHFAAAPDSGRISLESRIRNESVGDEDVGASFTIHFAHFSEVSRYESHCNVHKVMESLLPAIPYKHGTFVIMESTSEEAGEFFRKKFLNKNDTYDKIFLSWVSDDTYTLAEDPGPLNLGRSEDSPYGNEIIESENIKNELLFWYTEFREDKAALSREIRKRLGWRRWKINEPECHGDHNVFRRIYPTTVEDAFRSGVVGVFPAWILSSQEERMTKALETGIIGNAPYILTKKRFNPDAVTSESEDWFERVFEEHDDYSNQECFLEIHEQPIPDQEYVIGADPSYGLDYGDKAGAIVLKCGPRLVEVATWNYSVRPDEFAYLLYGLGAYYNWALIGVETNSMGWDTFNKILRELMYPNVYQKETVDMKLAPDITDDFGWFTTDRAKFMMINHARAALANRELEFRSLATISEFSQYQKMQNGKLGIPDGTVKGRSANLVMAGCIAVQMTHQIHIQVSKEPVKEKRTLAWWKKQLQRKNRPRPFRQVY